jgi:hypothetical protein
LNFVTVTREQSTGVAVVVLERSKEAGTSPCTRVRRRIATPWNERADLAEGLIEIVLF